jgi:hypothetical protein
VQKIYIGAEKRHALSRLRYRSAGEDDVGCVRISAAAQAPGQVSHTVGSGVLRALTGT